ncbi:hypothetical protein ES703_58021 [subsurface metagenome]
MDGERLFKFLKKQKENDLLEFLQSSFNYMDTEQRRSVFGKFYNQIEPGRINGKKLLQKIQKFEKDSFAGEYYAPFEINSKNFSEIPQETEMWFEELNELLSSSTQLSKQGDHAVAIECFSILYDLISDMDSGEEIVFADEYGSWMIPGDEKEYIRAYITSLAKMKSPEDFSDLVIPLIRRDSYESFVNKVYNFAIKVATDEQKSYLNKAIKSKKIKTKYK